MKRWFHILVVACALGLAAGGQQQAARAALGEPLQAGSTAAWWYHGQTPEQITALLSANNGRLVSLRVHSQIPLLLDVAMVQNSGTSAKTWWWYYGITERRLSDLATANDARIVNLEPYVVNGTTYFAAIMLHNVGADYAGWWWYYGVTADQIAKYLTANNARLIDLRHYGTGVYGAVMVSNTGANQSGWWWYLGATPQQIGQFVTQNNAWLASIDPADASGTTFNVVMNASAQGFSAYWYANEDAASVEKLTQSNSARIFDLKSYGVDGSERFAVLMLGNTWTATQEAEAECDTEVTQSWKAAPPAVGLGSAASLASYDATFTALIQQYGVPGGAVAVMKNGKLVLARGYGLSDIENLVIAHPDSLFRIASLSKQITAAAVLWLEQRGKLSLSANPFALLGFRPNPSVPVTGALRAVTIEQLLHHTGGWSRETGCIGCGSEGDPMFESGTISAAQEIEGPPDCDRIIAYMLGQPVQWTPGQIHDYSNFGYCVLGAVIERISGTRYADFVTANILAPAGAAGIVSGQTLRQADREVVYYDFPDASSGRDVFVPAFTAFTRPYGGFYLEAMAAHGAWIASPVDLLRFQDALDGRSGGAPLLDAARLAAMTANPNVLWSKVDAGNHLTTFTPSGTWYGMGWQINTAGNWWHTGSLPGTWTEQVHAANGFGWAAFFNSRPSDSTGFGNAIDAALWSAFHGTTSFGTADLFDQYGAYTGWMTAGSYQAQFNAAKAAGRYPSRVEGFTATGTPLYRAVFAPFHGSAWESRHGLACLEYRSLAAGLASRGYETASLQAFVSSDGTRRYQGTWVKW